MAKEDFGIKTAQMMDIHTILGLNQNSTEEEIKKNYYRRLREVHPHSGGCASRFIELQAAYSKYLLGDACDDCLAIFTNACRSATCRCRGEYHIPAGFKGRIECEFCSCFIFVEDAPLQLEK